MSWGEVATGYRLEPEFPAPFPAPLPLALSGEGAEGPEVSGWAMVLIASSGDPGPVPRGWPYQGQPWRVAGSRKPLMPEHI